jgi:hypothetical protein
LAGQVDVALRFDLYAAGVLAPGVGSLAELLTLRREGHGEPAAPLDLPSPMALPANERRRASQVVRLTLACTEQAMQSCPFAADRLRMVFASDEGTGEVCQQMLEVLATTREVSPLVFHNSVHNAPSGYLSIRYQNHQSALSVSLGRDSFASGLLCAAAEAQSSGQPVLFLSYDAPMPPPMRALLGVEQPSATAWIIAASTDRSTGAAAMASFDLCLRDAQCKTEDPPAAWLPATWARNGSALGFVALALLAEERGTCEFPLGSQRLRLARVDGGRAC